MNVDTGQLTGGVDGVQRLCKALISARFIQMALAAWGEEVVSSISCITSHGWSDMSSAQFFLELWAEINHRASLRMAVKGTSCLPDPHELEAVVPEDAIFEELVVRYGKLIKRSEDMIVQQICGETEHSLRRHFATMLSFVNRGCLAESRTADNSYPVRTHQKNKTAISYCLILFWSRSLYSQPTSHCCGRSSHRRLWWRYTAASSRG